MSNAITNMHDTVSPIPELTVFRDVKVNHMPAEGDQASHANVVMVTCELAAGGYLTVWADGTVQVSNTEGAKSYNYRAALLDTATPALRRLGPVS